MVGLRHDGLWRAAVPWGAPAWCPSHRRPDGISLYVFEPAIWPPSPCPSWAWPLPPYVLARPKVRPPRPCGHYIPGKFYTLVIVWLCRPFILCSNLTVSRPSACSCVCVTGQ